jgi:hypothetical protein
LVLAMVLLFFAAAEGATRLFIFEMSATLSRIRDEAGAAARLRGGGDAAPRRLLVVGNSLLMADVDVRAVDGSLQPEWRASRFAVEQTTYFDWYYGLRRLFRDGAQPDAVALFLEPRHLISTTVRTELFAYFLLSPGDILSVSRSLGLGPTGVADLALANFSAFYALRKELRKNLIGRLMPSLPDLMQMVAASPRPSPSLEQLVAAARTRLPGLKQITGANRSRLIFVVTPPVQADHLLALQEIGKEFDITIIAPQVDGDLAAADFDRDGYHLNEVGRQAYTRALIPLLRDALAAPRSASPNVSMEDGTWASARRLEPAESDITTALGHSYPRLNVP